MASNPGGISVAVTAVILLSFGLLSAILVFISRRRIAKREKEAEEGHEANKSVSSIPKYPPQLPNFSTRSSSSMSPETPSPKSPRSPGIRFMITAPSHRSRKSGSIDSLPSMETVLEKYEEEEDAAAGRNQDEDEEKTLSDRNLGEPGPNVMSERDGIKEELLIKTRHEGWNREEE